MLTVDDRGQVVLPRHVREKAGMNTGDRLALIVWEGNNKVCCAGLIKVECLNADRYKRSNRTLFRMTGLPGADRFGT